MDFPFSRLNADGLDPSDETFRVRVRYPESLRSSVRSLGIKTPLLVQFRGVGHRIVSGWGRWLNRPATAHVPCFIISSELPDEAVWDIFLRDNDHWNPVEIARVLGALERVPGLTEERIVREKLPLLGVRSSSDLWRRYRRLLDLGPAARELVETEDLPLRRAAILLKLPSDATDLVVRIVKRLRLTLNELGEALELLEEISAREAAPPLSVVRSVLEAAGCAGAAGASGAGGTLQDAGGVEATGGRGKEAFRQALRFRRYPELTRHNATLEDVQKGLRFSIPVRVEWDPKLERPGIRLFAEIHGAEALEAFERELEANREALKKLFETV